MNYTTLPARAKCNVCDNVQSIDSESCISCGVSFIVGNKDEWKSDEFTLNKMDAKIKTEWNDLINLYSKNKKIK